MLTWKQHAAAWAFAAAVFVCGGPAEAQETATAAALFDRGLAAMQANDIAAACPLLAESYRLDPQPGALFTLASCEARWGRTASAVAHFEDYLQLFSRMTDDQRAKQAGRDKKAAEQIAALKPTVPTLALQLPKDAPQGTTVSRDNVALGAAALGLPLPVDPGEHVIATQVPGGPRHEQRITIAAGEKQEVTVEIEVPPEPPPAPSVPAPTAVPTSTGSAAPPPRAPDSTGPGAWPYVIGGIGVVGLAVGGITGTMAMSKKKTVDDNCVGEICNHEGKTAADSGKTLATISTVGFGVGAAGVITSMILFLTSSSGNTPSSSAARVEPLVGQAGADGAMMGVQGRW